MFDSKRRWRRRATRVPSVSVALRPNMDPQRSERVDEGAPGTFSMTYGFPTAWRAARVGARRSGCSTVVGVLRDRVRLAGRGGVDGVVLVAVVGEVGEGVGLVELERVAGLGSMSTPTTSKPARW
jgi:hypothetical protein